MEEHRLTIAIAIFMVIFIAINMIKPAILYKRDGTLRQFGIGSSQKTIVPIWLATILLAVFSYIGIIYYYGRV
jgi:hypothetical protein